MAQNVLIVEDDADIAMLIELRLGLQGYTTRIAGTAPEAMAMLAEFSPRVIVTDWMMPGMSGVEMCKLIRADASITQPYIIVLTARTERSYEDVARSAGADGYLHKPISFPLLVGSVEAACVV